MRKVICILGPTASGKTELAIRLSEQIPVDIISVDSAMVYRGMNIGTAKPTADELSKAPHQLLDLRDAADSYSAGQFCVDAMQCISKAFVNNRTPLLVGGTMLYFHKLLFGLAELPTADPKIRDQLEKEAEKIGWIAMHEKLRVIDPVAAEKIKPQDPQRISRALEVFLITGKPISELQKNNAPALLSSEKVVAIGLMPEDRAWLHERIAQRFENMLKNGFIDEVKQFHARGDLSPDLPAMRTVGYRQVWEYLDEKISFEEMKHQAVVATRQLAKRQMTWMRSWSDLVLFDPQDPDLLEKVMYQLCQS